MCSLLHTQNTTRNYYLSTKYFQASQDQNVRYINFALENREGFLLLNSRCVMRWGVCVAGDVDCVNLYVACMIEMNIRNTEDDNIRTVRNNVCTCLRWNDGRKKVSSLGSLF